MASRKRKAKAKPNWALIYQKRANNCFAAALMHAAAFDTVVVVVRSGDREWVGAAGNCSQATATELLASVAKGAVK